jgi:hypothetical protein
MLSEIICLVLLAFHTEELSDECSAGNFIQVNAKKKHNGKYKTEAECLFETADLAEIRTSKNSQRSLK